MPTTITKTIMPGGGGDYTSLSAWESARQRDLPAADEIERAECYSGGSLGRVQLAGWTVDSTRYIEIFVPTAERWTNAGRVWTTSKAYISASDAAGGGNVNSDMNYTRITGLQVQQTADDNNCSCFNMSTTFGWRISHCLVRGLRATTNGSSCYGITGGVDAGGDNFVWNTVVYDVGRSGASNSAGIRTENHTSGKTYVYYCTVHTTTDGITDNFSDVIAKNCLVKGADSNDYEGTFSASSTNNASEDATAPGSNNRTSQTFTFVDEGGDDFGLSGSDTGALGFGTSLSGDANNVVTDDAMGNARHASTPDIGAFEFQDTATAPVRLKVGGRDSLLVTGKAA